MDEIAEFLKEAAELRKKSAAMLASIKVAEGERERMWVAVKEVNESMALAPRSIREMNRALQMARNMLVHGRLPPVPSLASTRVTIQDEEPS